MLLYIGLVSFFSILFIIMSNQAWFEPISNRVLSGYAWISSAILNLLGQQTDVDGQSIAGQGFSISIRKGCDALAPMILYLFSIAFFNTDLKHKMKGLLIGLPVLAVINIIRICTLYLIGKYSTQTIFDIMHVDVWQIFFIVLTLVIWVQWLKKTQKIPNAQA